MSQQPPKDTPSGCAIVFWFIVFPPIGILLALQQPGTQQPKPVHNGGGGGLAVTVVIVLIVIVMGLLSSPDDNRIHPPMPTKEQLEN